MFSSRKEITSHFQKSNQEFVVVNHLNSFEKNLYEKYHFFLLPEEKLQFNLYPNSSHKIYEKYKKTVKREDENDITKKIYSLDCEMVSLKFDKNLFFRLLQRTEKNWLE